MQRVQTAEQEAVGGQFRQRIESKFFILPNNIDLAYGLLRQVCRPDIDYPEGQINSLYFDTVDLEQHERSLSGEYKKDKVRIRWYDKFENLQETVPVFVELKSRRGFSSSKKRAKFFVSREDLQLDRLNAGIIKKTMLEDTIAGFGHFPPETLMPIIAVSYLRYRFTEIMTGVRVSLDHNIRSTFIARDLGYGERELPLRGGVIEVKAPTMELPRTLRRMKLLKTDWSRFSKYSHCIDSHREDLGSIARLWPSGRVVLP